MESKKGSGKIQALTQKIEELTPTNMVEKEHGEIRVLAAIPRGGFGQPEAQDSREDVKFYLGRLQEASCFKFYNGSFGRTVVHLSRDLFAKYTLIHDCDFLFMMDDDMIFPLDMFIQLYNRMVENSTVDICTALAFQRREPYFPVIYMQREGIDPVRKEPYFANEIVMNYPKNTLFECDASGFGAVLIKKKVIVGMNEPYFLSTNPSGEDILFCYNARKAGFRVFVDTACKTTHLGAPLLIDEALYEKTNNINREYLGEAEYKK